VRDEIVGMVAPGKKAESTAAQSPTPTTPGTKADNAPAKDTADIPLP
jgi:hypothetical protein